MPSFTDTRERALTPPDCDGEDQFCSDVERRAIYQTLLDAAAARVLIDPPRTGPAGHWPDWDRRTRSAAMRAVGDEVGLTGREWAAISRNGFAVLRGVQFANPYEAYKTIYRTELPLFVTADSILHAVFRSHEMAVRVLEAPLPGAISASLTAMHQALPAMRASLPDDVARDLDLYLAVGRALAVEGAPTALDASQQAQAVRLVEAVNAASEIDEHVVLFGRTRVVDFTAYAPRGPYADDPGRARWFRVARWLSRLEFNVVSRDCRSSQPGAVPDPAETPREALDAFALAELAERAGQLDRLRDVANLWGALAGRREDLGLDDLRRLRVESGVTSLRAPDAFARLSHAVGNGFQRTARTHPMPQNVRVMPAIATVLGPRVVADAAMTRPLVHDEIAERYRLGAADVAYALGHDGAARYLAADFARFPTLHHSFDRARTILDAAHEGDDLYSRWLDALRTLAHPTTGVRPSFMTTRAWDDLRLNTLVVGYGQLRHANALVAAESYDGAACRIPDAWLEPTPDLYRALRRYLERLGEVLRTAHGLSASHDAAFEPWLAQTDRALRVLQRIAQDELSGHALTESQRLFLSYVAEVLPSTEGAPTHTGWYLDLFPDLDTASGSADFVADWYASVNDGSVSYVGSSGVALGAFVVDRGGAPRLMVGPVALGYEHHGALARRLNDREARELPIEARSAPWAQSYTVAPAPAPVLSFLEGADAFVHGTGPLAARYGIDGGATPGVLVVELLSSHRRVLARGSAVVGARPTSLVVRWVSGVHRAPQGDDGGEGGVADVCAVRLRHGDWVTTERTDEYPFSDHCEAPDLAGHRYGPSRTEVPDEGSAE